jgi:hypothetical protein
MTEKRFTFHISEYDEVVITKENDGREFFIGNEEDINMDYIIGLVDLLNEQHATITKQQERIHSLMKYNLECDDKVKETLQSFSNRDLLDIERIFLNNLCDELGVDLE